MFERGVKLELLRRVRDLVSSSDHTITTQEVYEKYIQSWTPSASLSFLDSLSAAEAIPHEDLREIFTTETLLTTHTPPNLFICHTSWSNNFISFCHSIEQYCERLTKESIDSHDAMAPSPSASQSQDQQEIVLWIDIFCLNSLDFYHRHVEYLESILSEGLRKIGRAVLILPTIPSDKTLFCSTCLWEIFLISDQLLEFDIFGSQEDLNLFQQNLNQDVPSVDISISSSISTENSQKLEIFHLIEQYFKRQSQESQGVVNDSSLLRFNQIVHATFIEWKHNQIAAEKAAAEMAAMTSAADDDETKDSNLVTAQLEILSIKDEASEVQKSDFEPPSLLEGTVIEMGIEKLIMFSCPYEECQGTITVAPNQINCGVFRHGVYKASGRPVGAHLSEDKCLELVRQGKVYGCVQPFRIRKIPIPSLETAVSVAEVMEGDVQDELVSKEVTVAAEDEKKKNQTKPKKKQQQKKKREFRYFIEKCGYI